MISRRVPVEPTQAMLDVLEGINPDSPSGDGISWQDYQRKVYSQLLAAAPAEQETEQPLRYSYEQAAEYAKRVGLPLDFLEQPAEPVATQDVLGNKLANGAQETQTVANPAPAAAPAGLVVTSVGGQCGICGFRYWEHNGHLIACPVCALAKAREETIEECADACNKLVGDGVKPSDRLIGYSECFEAIRALKESHD